MNDAFYTRVRLAKGRSAFPTGKQCVSGEQENEDREAFLKFTFFIILQKATQSSTQPDPLKKQKPERTLWRNTNTCNAYPWWDVPATTKLFQALSCLQIIPFCRILECLISKSFVFWRRNLIIVSITDEKLIKYYILKLERTLGHSMEHWSHQ